jgi:hypothetical protein
MKKAYIHVMHLKRLQKQRTEKQGIGNIVGSADHFL